MLGSLLWYSLASYYALGIYVGVYTYYDLKDPFKYKQPSDLEMVSLNKNEFRG